MALLRPETHPTRRSRPSRGLFGRVLAGLWLVLHVLTVAVVPVADGFADHGAVAATHVEDADRGDCPADHHGAQHCKLCQLLQAERAFPGSADALTTAPSVVAYRRPVAVALLPTHAAARVGSSPRAPPAIG